MMMMFAVRQVALTAVVTAAVDVILQGECRTECQDCLLRRTTWTHYSACLVFSHNRHHEMRELQHAHTHSILMAIFQVNLC